MASQPKGRARDASHGKHTHANPRLTNASHRTTEMNRNVHLGKVSHIKRPSLHVQREDGGKTTVVTDCYRLKLGEGGPRWLLAPMIFRSVRRLRLATRPAKQSRQCLAAGGPRRGWIWGRVRRGQLAHVHGRGEALASDGCDWGGSHLDKKGLLLDDILTVAK